MNIRPYRKEDRNGVRYVCLYCDGPEDISGSTQNFLLSTYCDYYIEKESYNCFVAADDCNKVLGYVICTENYDRFIDCFRNEYIPRIPEEEKTNRIYAENSTVLQGKHKNDYPAHFHIGILPEYQRMGIGHKLLDTLLSHLDNKGVKGVMLTVNSENKKGIAFYRKYGFSLIEKNHSEEVFGINFMK